MRLLERPAPDQPPTHTRTEPGAARPAGRTSAGRDSAGPLRDPWPDNAKLLLIGLVVLGHSLSKGITGRMPVADALYVWIYLFHMPAFIFLAGYFSKATRLSERTLQNVATRLLVPYVLFTGIYALAMFALGHTPTLDLVHPYWLLWFLPALAAWRLFTPLFLNLRWPVGISLFLGLAAGFVSRIDVDFSLSRIFAFAPFFVLGAVATPEHLHRLQQPLARLAAVGVLLATAAGTWWLHDDIATRTIFWNGGYEAQGLAPVTGLLVRIAMYAVGLALLLAVLSLTPTRRGWWTGIGAASLYVYLLHGFVVRAADAFGWYDHVSSLAGLAVLVVLVATVTVLLGSAPVRRLTRPVVEPPLGWLLRRDGGATRHSSKSSTTSSESGTDWQASTKPAASSSGSRA